jgi:histidine ammonia-lyase
MSREVVNLRRPEVNDTKKDPHHTDKVVLTGSSLTIEDVVAVARDRRRIAPLSPENERMLESRNWVEKVMAGEVEDKDGNPLPVYGVNTPFGSLAFKNKFETTEEARNLSRNLITSHSAGVGQYFPEDIVRAAALVRANTLAKGFSGIRPGVVNSLIQTLNADIHPAVPEKGSVGASGDLAPLSHLVLTISKPPEGHDSVDQSGEVLIPFDPEVHNPADCVVVGSTEGQEVPKVKTYAKPVMEKAGVRRWILGAKEGLALNNGATFCAAMAALAVYDAELLVKNAEIALAMTVEAVKGYRDAFFPQVHRARGHQGQIDSAANVYRLVEGSQLLEGDQSKNPDKCPPQDAYSIRCAPQVIGAVRDVLDWVRNVIEVELNAATDNPLIFASDENDEYHLPRQYKAVSCGNFHGEPLAFAMDFLGIVIAELGNVAERRIFRLLADSLNRGLDSMLIHADDEELGMHNAFMIPQYTAAALVSENKTLAHPDSVDSIPTCENQEDHVSMAPNAARHTCEIIWNVQQIIGIEMLCAAQALDFRAKGEGYVYEEHRTDASYKKKEWQEAGEMRLGRGTEIAHARIRESIKYWDRDRIMYPELNRAGRIVSSGKIVRAVEEKLGSLL